MEAIVQAFLSSPGGSAWGLWSGLPESPQKGEGLGCVEVEAVVVV